MTQSISQVPAHVGIIMDGNGRWAERRSLPRVRGHLKGLEIAKKVVARASEIGISWLSLFAFSTENWKRTESEVQFLMNLIKINLRKQYSFYRENSLKVVHSGDLGRLPIDVHEEILKVEEATENNQGMVINLLINYGGRDEIVRAMNRCSRTDQSIKSEEKIHNKLDHPEAGNLDLLIRTGGEKRISNFMLWQSAYAELFFSDVLWPDWSEKNLDEAIADFRQRPRRYGGLV